jgi:hypothetical protein
MPEWSLVSLIEASPHNPGTAYVALDCHKLDDLKPYIYKTADLGKSWTKITNGIPDGAYVHAVREDPVKPGLLFAGTETSVYVSFDNGANWQSSVQLNLPTTPIHDLVVKNNDLVVATHGRSFWILDDITPLRKLASLTPNADGMFVADTVYRLHFPDEVDRRRPVGENPMKGAIFSYFLKSAPKGEVKLEILDDKGSVLRKFSSVEEKGAETPPEWPDLEVPNDKIPAAAGWNRFAWDLRITGPHRLPGEVEGEFRSRGPVALPGKYQVRLTVGSEAPITAPFELKMDPRVKTSLADMQKEFDLQLKIRDTLSNIHDTVREIRETRMQIKGLHSRLEDARYKAISDSANALDTKMTPVEEQLLQVHAKSTEANLNFPVLIDEQLHGLANSVESDAAPTAQQVAAYEALSQQAAPLLAQWKQLRSGDLVALNDMIKRDAVPVIYLGPGESTAESTKAGAAQKH